MNESCYTYDWVVSHLWMSHVTRINESWHIRDDLKDATVESKVFYGGYKEFFKDYQVLHFCTRHTNSVHAGAHTPQHWPQLTPQLAIETDTEDVCVWICRARRICTQSGPSSTSSSGYVLQSVFHFVLQASGSSSMPLPRYAIAQVCFTVRRRHQRSFASPRCMKMTSMNAWWLVQGLMRMSRDSFICHVTHSYVTSTQSYMTRHIYKWHDSFIATWFARRAAWLVCTSVCIYVHEGRANQDGDGWEDRCTHASARDTHALQHTLQHMLQHTLQHMCWRC